MSTSAPGDVRPGGRRLLLAGVLFALFIVYTFLVVHWGPFIRLDHDLDRNFHIHRFWPELHVVDRIGQRAVCLPILTAVMVTQGWRYRSWRPPVLAVGAVFVVNLLVLIAKLAMSRGRPLTGDGFFTGGDDYPSGHTGNVIVVYGMCCYLMLHYGRVSRPLRKVFIGIVGLLCVIMLFTSLLLRWHWFSDLIGGFMLGGAVIALFAAIDAARPLPPLRGMRRRRADPAVPSSPSPGQPLAPLSAASTEPGDLPRATNGASSEVSSGATSGAASAGITQPDRPPGSPVPAAGRRYRR